jgi:para-nitrobenzyl esterase
LGFQARRWTLWTTMLAGLAGAMPLWTPLAAGGMSGQPDQGVTVVTDAGPVQGEVADGFLRFQGIPYAAPPVGELRWRSPRPVEPWTEPRNATDPGSPCSQVSDPLTGGDAGAEDCLYLNVTVPGDLPPNNPKPVIVWIHGAFFGGGAGHVFDPRRLAVQGDVVVVTINYRLGTLGFFGYPGLEGAGAYGLEDQQAALRWVQRNAAAFGGDPGNVTVAGESAGGMSVCAHLTSPEAAGLFHRAIIQSGSCLIDWPANTILPNTLPGSIWATTAEVEAIGQTVARDLGCGDPAPDATECLRRLPATELVAHPLSAAFSRPAFGNRILPENPAIALREGRIHRVPVLTGHTRDEGRLFAELFFDGPETDDEYRALLDAAFGDQGARVAATYPTRWEGSPGLTWAAIITDRVWVCPTLAGNRFLARVVPTYAYEFADRDAPGGLPDAPTDFPLGAYHSAELQYLFDFVGEEAQLTPEQRELADRMIGYWANFAAAGDPNGPDLPLWPPFQDGDLVPHVQRLTRTADGLGSVDAAAEHRCGFWASLPAA